MPENKQSAQASTRVDTDPRGTTRSGFAGLFESVMRRYKTAVHAITMLPLFGLAAAVMGLAVLPASLAFRWSWHFSEAWPLAARAPWLSFFAAGAFFIFGFSLLVILPIVNRLLGGRLEAWRGPYFSWPVVHWYIHNGLTYLARYVFLEFVTPTPFNILFYRWMGMKIGENVQINSTNISDPCLIELEDNVTIGGSATLVAHYGMGGFLVISPTKVCKGATVGLKATIMGGVEIGEGAKIMPNSVVLPRTKVPAGETWGGVPARKIEIGRKKKAA